MAQDVKLVEAGHTGATYRQIVLLAADMNHAGVDKVLDLGCDVIGLA